MNSPQQLGKKIAEGRTAEIYAWKPGWLLKLYREWVPASDAAHEARVTRAAHASGFRAPAIGDLIEVQGRSGLEMEHIQGQDMLTAMMRQPWRLDRLARQMAEIHQAMFTHRPENLPDQHDVLRRRLESAPYLEDRFRQRLLARLEILPSGDSLLHGDLHPFNVILAPDGPMVIDWIDAKRGNPLADVARSSVLFTIGKVQAPFIERIFTGFFRYRFHTVYRRAIFAGQPEARAEYRQWLPIMAAARLNEGIESDNPLLLEATRRWMA